MKKFVAAEIAELNINETANGFWNSDTEKDLVLTVFGTEIGRWPHSNDNDKADPEEEKKQDVTSGM